MLNASTNYKPFGFYLRIVSDHLHTLWYFQIVACFFSSITQSTKKKNNVLRSPTTSSRLELSLQFRCQPNQASLGYARQTGPRLTPYNLQELKDLLAHILVPDTTAHHQGVHVSTGKGCFGWKGGNQSTNMQTVINVCRLVVCTIRN